MPVITVSMLEGRTREQKRELVAVFSREMARITGCSEASVHVLVEELKKENWGVGGELCADKFPD